MTTNLVEMKQALDRSAMLQAAAAIEHAMAVETKAESIAEKGQAIEFQQEATMLMEESAANQDLVANDQMKVEEIEEEISTLHAEAAAHAVVVEADGIWMEEESAQVVADTAKAARTESQARGEEVGIAFCELIPILDIACDVVGGITAVGLETAVTVETIKVAEELAVMSATKLEEEKEMALTTEAEESVALDQALADGIQTDAAQKSELAQQEQLEAEMDQEKADTLVEKSKADEVLAEEVEEVTAVADDAESDRQATIALKKLVAASWNALLAAGCGLLLMSFFLFRTLINVVVSPATRWTCLPSATKFSLSTTFGLYHTFSKDTSYLYHHCIIFLLVAVSFQSLFTTTLPGMSARARGGILLSFACAAALVQTVSLHLIPNALLHVENNIGHLITDFWIRMLVLALLFTIEIVTMWVILGEDVLFNKLLLLYIPKWMLLFFWLILTVSLSVHISRFELSQPNEPNQCHSTMRLHLTDHDDTTEETHLATETSALIRNNLSIESTRRRNGSLTPSMLTLLYQQLVALQIPLQILVLAWLFRIVISSTRCLHLIWPLAKPMMILLRPRWIVPVSVSLVGFFFFGYAFSIFFSMNRKRESEISSNNDNNDNNNTVSRRHNSCWQCVLLCLIFLSSSTLCYAFQIPQGQLTRTLVIIGRPQYSTIHCLSRNSKTRSKRKQCKLFSTASAVTSEGGADRNTTINFKANDNTTVSIPYHWTSQNFELAIPALIGMLADPLLSLVDTAYVGRVGATELAALGACTSIFHLAFNAFRATTAATTSLVGNAVDSAERQQVIQLSLCLGVLLGILVTAVLQLAGPWCLATMGVPQHSVLYTPAIAYLGTRLWAAPAVLAIVVSEGAFRGYGDTKIPLLASLLASFINLVLDPILMFPLGWGVKGAAAATGLSQVGAALIYFYFLMKRGMLPKRNAKSIVKKSRVISTILGANMAMITKQGSMLLAWAYATARATRIGSAHVAAHQVALSCWLVFALMLDGAAVSAQVLMSRSMGQFRKVKSLVWYMIRFSILQGLATTGALLLASPVIPNMFTTDATIRWHLKSLMPLLAWQQLLVSLTLVTESLAIGGNQFQLLAFGTTLSTILAMGQLQQATTVVDIWSRGIVTLFVGRLVTALIGTVRLIRAQSQGTQPQEANEASTI
jgi:putative MATE family efflux protein